MLVNWLVAFAKLTHCSAERTFCIRKIVRLLGGGIQKKKWAHIFVCLSPRILAVGFSSKICKLSFTNKHRSIYCCLACGVRKVNALLGWANFLHSQNRSFAGWRYPKKRESFRFFVCVSTQNTRHEVFLLSTSFILFYLLLVPLSLLLARGVRKANALHTSSELFAFAKSFACWVEVSKKKRTL